MSHVLAPHLWIDIVTGLRITAHGAAWLPEHGTAVIADVHLGYARAARRRGGYLPNVEDAEALSARVLAMTNALGTRRLVIAGDLRHSTRDVDDGERAEVSAFLDRLSSLEQVELVAGNHDRGSKNMSPAVQIGDIDIRHVPPGTAPERWTICGHIHPSAVLHDETGASARFPCAMAGSRILVLPAFTTWAGGTRVARLMKQLPPGEWRRFVIGGGGVVEM